MRQISRVFLIVFALATTLGALSACNTMAGAGQDISNGGKDLQNSADRNGAQPSR